MDTKLHLEARISNVQESLKVRFYSSLIQHSYKFIRHSAWPTRIRIPSTPFPFTTWFMEEEVKGMIFIYFEHEHCIGWIQVQGGYLYWHLAGEETKALDAIQTLLLSLYPKSVPDRSAIISMDFWSHTDDGPRSISRRLAVPAWEEIAINYAASTREILSPLMQWRKHPP